MVSQASCMGKLLKIIHWGLVIGPGPWPYNEYVLPYSFLSQIAGLYIIRYRAVKERFSPAR